MGWAKNGANAGTAESSLALEAFEITIVAKGAPAPGSTSGAFTTKPFRIRNLNPAKPMIALTFDDGPGSNTTRLLNILDKHGARATFFVVGTNVSQYPGVLRDAYNRGHEIAGHSMNHQDYTSLGAGAIQTDITRINQAIKNATGGAPPAFYRAPYGAINQNVTNASAGVGYSLIQWNIDPQDWLHRDANTVYNNVMGAARPGAIVVLHDVHPTTVTAMERVVPDLMLRGYQVVTVSELLYYSKTSLVPGRVYNSG
jgi:peptidoglycan/xylan/chitin deacetylase (PgdA/CDA1 family)